MDLLMCCFNRHSIHMNDIYFMKEMTLLKFGGVCKVYIEEYIE